MSPPPRFTRSAIGQSAFLLAAAVALTPTSSSACGGTFCDSGPQAMPVDQTGENVLFVMDGPYVEAHVQIQYTPGATRFAWVVPMPAVPEVSIGSAPLFAALMQGTVPTFGNFVVRDFCGDPCRLGSGGASFGAGGSSASSADAGTVGGPTVVLKETVGAFEVVALQGGTAQEVSDWLTTNGYASTATAPALLGDYVARGYVFVAVKLTSSADVDEIHPLVFRYLGSEPCIPLKLTAVAASEDMGVRAFFLGEDRVFPSNYKHVVVNPLRIDWRSSAANYKDVVSRAVDSAVADGRAFITEFAGPTQSAVSASTVYSPAWVATPYATAEPSEVVGLLNGQGLASCYWPYQCLMNHPLVLGLLREFLPSPPGVDEATYYSELVNAPMEGGTFPAWDGVRFAAALDERVIVPARHASDLLANQPYLTRLFTTISPSEMTQDPEFVARPEHNTPGVTLGGFSTQRFACDGTSGFSLPGTTRQVGADPSGVWPVFSSRMPHAERIEEYGATGAPIVLIDNTSRIEQELADWNASVGWPAPPPPPPDLSQCGPGSGSGGAGSGSVRGGGGTATGPNGDQGSGVGGSGSGDVDASGGCNTSGGRDGKWTIFGMGLLGLLARRRRASRG